MAALRCQGQVANRPAAPAESNPNQAARPDSLSEVQKGANEFGVWGGGSFHSSTLVGKVEDAKLGIVGLRYARVLKVREGYSLKYTVDAIPVVALSFPRLELFQTGPGPQDFTVRLTRAAVYGAGLAPLGVQLNLGPHKRRQPFLQTSGGFAYMAESVPDSGGKQFNFTVDLGGGVQVFTRSHRAFTIGYRYHHLSNGYRGQANPGFDSNVFYAGFSIFK